MNKKKKNDKPKIHFWVPYPLNTAPSQRFRIELFFPLLKKNEYDFEVYSFLDQKAWDVLYTKGKGVAKTVGIIKGFFRRFWHVFLSIKADYVFLHRESSPVGPPIFEWLLTKVFRRKLILEYDDAIWIPGGEKIGLLKKWLKSTWKVKYIIKWAYKVVGGNDFLCNYARQFNADVILIPTVVDTEHGHHKIRNQFDGERIIVGWTGTHTTLLNLEEIETLIPELKREIEFDFLIISNKPPDWDFDFIYIKWHINSEIEDLLKMHIGVMPLKKGPWFEGKCGFKLIQYMACGIPSVASPVGVNMKIINDKEDGFIANNREEWKSSLRMLIKDASLRDRMAIKGRDCIVEKFSLKSQEIIFLDLFKN